MNQEQRTTVVENYYKATNALMAIGTLEGVPEELKQLAVKASAATIKIIDYVNAHKEEPKSVPELYKDLCKRFFRDSYGSYSSVFNVAYNIGAITDEQYEEARNYYGKMWNYSGD